MDAFNAADAQRHLQDVSEVSFLPRIHPCRFGTAPNRRRDDKFKPRINGSEPRTSLLEDDVFLWLCRLEAISPSIRCHEIEHLLNTGVAFPGRGVAVGYVMKSLLLLPNCPIAHLQLFSLSFRPHAPPPADHFRRPQRYEPTNNCNRLWHHIHKKQHNKPN